MSTLTDNDDLDEMPSSGSHCSQLKNGFSKKEIVLDLILIGANLPSGFPKMSCQNQPAQQQRLQF